jgi:hypothetical protein
MKIILPKNKTDQPKVLLTRNDMIELYVKLLASNCPDDIFKPINYLIISRWSLSALDFIKTKAWQRIEKKTDPRF